MKSPHLSGEVRVGDKGHDFSEERLRKPEGGLELLDLSGAGRPGNRAS